MYDYVCVVMFHASSVEIVCSSPSFSFSVMEIRLISTFVMSSSLELAVVFVTTPLNIWLAVLQRVQNDDKMKC